MEGAKSGRQVALESSRIKNVVKYHNKQQEKEPQKHMKEKHTLGIKYWLEILKEECYAL